MPILPHILHIHRPTATMLKYLTRAALYTVGLLLLYTVGLVAIYLAFNDNLPDIDAWSFQPKRITRVFSSDGQHLKDFLEENREIVTYDEIPKAMQDALIAIEDQRFYSHWGIDIRRIFGSLLANLKDMRIVGQGASTLTQQVARNIFTEVGQARGSATVDAVLATYARKIREQITAVQIERLYTKQEILTLYLNTVFFGHNCYGLKAAARFYFDKEVDELTVDECALLAGLLPAPNIYSPYRNPDKALRRRNQVLASMVQTKKLSSATCLLLQQQPVMPRRSQRAETYGLAPYFIEYVRQQLEHQYGSGLYRDGVTIHTTLDSRLQQIAEKHFAIEIGKVQQRVNQYLARQDSSTGLPDSALVQAAFVAIDPHTGHILAMIGGRDFSESKFNRAVQAKRQAGSSFKPFVYTAAIDNNRFPCDILDDNAITLWENGHLWDPENYDRKFLGPMTLRDGFKQSRNLIAIKLAEEIGPRLIRRYARNMGITTRINAVPSIGIGTSDVHLLDLVSAYCVFPNNGIYVEPVSFISIVDQEGNTIYTQPTGRKREVLRPAVAVIMTDLMRSVVDEQGGTGRAIRTIYRFRGAAAGKTGTTNDYRDAWFVGFTPHIVAGIWVGMDDPSLRLWRPERDREGQSGAVAALPLWARFMKEVYSTVEPYRDLADETFVYPDNLVVRLPVCEDTHKLATRYCPNQKEDLFIRGEALPPECPLHGGAGKSKGRIQRF